MAHEQKAKCGVVTFLAGEDLTKYYLVILDPSTDKQVLLPTADNMECIGVVQDSTDSGDAVPVLLLSGNGLVTVYAGASVTRGDLVIADDAGKAITDPETGSGSKSKIVGLAVESKTTGQELLIMPLKMTIYYA